MPLYIPCLSPASSTPAVPSKLAVRRRQSARQTVPWKNSLILCWKDVIAPPASCCFLVSATGKHSPTKPESVLPVSLLGLPPSFTVPCGTVFSQRGNGSKW